MNKLFETALFTRKAMLDILEGLTEKQYSKIPEGHRNSIFWNIAHVMVTQQLLLYSLSGLPLMINDSFVKRYSKGTHAEPEVSKQDVEFVRENLLGLCLRAEKDWNKGLFQNYKSYLTSADIELNTIQDGIEFSGYHDGIHLGVVLSLKKLV
jgi:hypothetical protein